MDLASWYRRWKGARCWHAPLCIASFSGRTPTGKAVLRAFLGGMKNEALLAESDEALVATVRRELSEILGGIDRPRCQPEHTQVSRWRRAMAQYAVGHQERMKRIKARVAHAAGAEAGRQCV